MMRIVRTCKVWLGKPGSKERTEVVVECCTRGPFLTETVMHDGRKRRVVIELAGDELRLRYAKSKRLLVVEKYEDLIKRERARKWKVGPRGTVR
jgi:hypothetical protein